ncbi:MAG: hypothetical protein R3E66_22795 [bacterium]
MRKLIFVTVCLWNTAGWAQEATAPADPPALKLSTVIVGNAILNSGTPFPTEDAPAGAVMASGDDLPTDTSLNLTARQTKFGLQTFTRLDPDTTLSGLLEMDFFGLHENAGPAGSIQSAPRLRLAYGKLAHGRWDLRIGQDWSVVTPRLPTSSAHMVVVLHSFGGAVWNRLPQVTGRWTGEGTFHAGVAVSAARPHSGDATAVLTRFEGPDPGSLSSLPAAQARVFFVAPHVEVGVAGHFATERYATTDADKSIPSWLGSADLNVDLKPVNFAGQGYCGQNINGFFSRAGVKATLDAMDAVTDVEGLRACGGWLEAKLALGPITAVVSGSVEYGEEELFRDNAAFKQWDAFGGIAYRPWKPFEVSLEYLHTTTSYKNAADGNNESIALTGRFFFDAALSK